MNEYNQLKKDGAQAELLEKIQFFEALVNNRVRQNLSLKGLPRNISQFLSWAEGDLTQTNRTYLYSDCNKVHLTQVKTLIKQVKKPTPRRGDDIKALKSEVKTLKQQVVGLVDANRDLRSKLEVYEAKLNKFESNKRAKVSQIRCT